MWISESCIWPTYPLHCLPIDRRQSDTRLLFSVGLPMEGIPAERHAAIFRSIITNRDAFFRYLRLLLSELGDPFAVALAAHSGTTEARPRGRG